ncbi:hypothetical protein [Amycolatopsis sp. cmx-4-54]|uniref:hypothetical protein n=1 Tax=Amycolatopsis sp. cmx-4-54 TaxID=2790936 RepID=UPI00397B836D
MVENKPLPDYAKGGQSMVKPEEIAPLSWSIGAKGRYSLWARAGQSQLHRCGAG